MVCDIFKKLGATCKAGNKSGKCPQLAKKAKKGGKKEGGFDAAKLVGIDQPFDYQEVVSVTGPEYVRNMDSDGYAFVPYEELKQRMAKTLADRNIIDVDIPFDREEVAKATGEQYADHLSRSDMPQVEITARGDLAGFCETGQMVCDIFKKLGATCKAGNKSGKCPQLAKKKKAKGAKKSTGFDAATYIAPDMPFEYREVARVAGPDYVEHLVYDGTVQVPYEAVKAQWEKIQASESQPAAPAETEKTAAGAPILVIDDEVAVNNNIRKILGKKGYAVEQATSKQEALEKFESGSYRLILLDLKMPGVQGLELLRAASEKQADARVIIITGYASIETAVESARMGAVAYLPKPFTPGEIRSATEDALQLQMAA
jgi:CheY-like chemotaxis protein